MKVWWLLLVLALVIVKIETLKVLTISPFLAPSHFVIGSAIAKSLHKAGHEITMLSPFPLKRPMANYTDISIVETIANMQNEAGAGSDFFDWRNLHGVILLTVLYSMTGQLTDAIMLNDQVVKLMKSNEKYDVCVVENFNMDALLGIAEHVDCVVVSYTTFGAVKWIDDMTSNQSPQSYVVNPFLHYTDRMSFTERLINTFSNIFESIGHEFYYKPLQRRIYSKHFPNAKRTFDEMYKSPAVFLINSHVSSAAARPYLPNMIEICGIHVEPAKPLPNDIQQFLDSADDGVIVFSMGSNIQSVNWPLEKREVFNEVFGKLKQKVLWKYENDTLPGKPDNVMISKWLPQRDVIAHSNVKLFITHGGLLGTTEALIEGIPLLGIPIFGDQKMNMAKAVTRGYALQLYFDDISADSLYEALNELLSNQKYRQNAQEISKRFIDRPMTPQQTVNYWVEYAVRHKGAPHLRAAGNELNFIEFHSIDTYGVLFVGTVVYLYVVYLVFRCLIRKCCRTSNVKVKKN